MIAIEVFQGQSRRFWHGRSHDKLIKSHLLESNAHDPLLATSVLADSYHPYREVWRWAAFLLDELWNVEVSDVACARLIKRHVA